MGAKGVVPWVPRGMGTWVPGSMAIGDMALAAWL